MCIKSAPQFYKNVLIGHLSFKYIASFDALVLMSQIAPLEGAVRAYFFTIILNLNQIKYKFVPNSTQKVHFLHHCKKLVLFRYRKSAGTKMHKCLAGMFLFQITCQTFPQLGEDKGLLMQNMSQKFIIGKLLSIIKMVFLC